MMLENQTHIEIMIKLRDYQNQAINSIRESFKESPRQYIEMPTGSGKTITFLSYARKYHKNILIIVPSRELLNQVYETSLLFYHSSEISRKGNGFNEKIALVHICIINSIRSEYLEFIAPREFDLTIIDEAHHLQSDSYKCLINRRADIFKQNDMKILGVTATPDRLDGKLLKDILYKCSFSISVQDLIDRGGLCDVEGFSVKTNIDLSEIDHHNGDFSLKQLYNKLSTSNRNNLIIDICKNDMKNRKTLIFCINIQHSKEINELLNSKGISSCHIDGTMDTKKRNSILSAFRLGEIDILCNCQLLTEGFDEPSINGILLARPTRSRALFMQMIGRGLRIFIGKKKCKIVDIVDNHKRLAGFNHLISDCDYPEMTSFKSIRDIQKHIREEGLKITDFIIQRTDLLNERPMDDLEATESQTNYLDIKNIYYQHPISFDEASFLIWHDKLKKEFHGQH